jgi:hypothetical protein
MIMRPRSGIELGRNGFDEKRRALRPSCRPHRKNSPDKSVDAEQWIQCKSVNPTHEQSLCLCVRFMYIGKSQNSFAILLSGFDAKQRVS